MKQPGIFIEVAYASPERSIRCKLKLNPGSSVGDAICACGLLEQCTEIDLARNRVGIFGRLVSLSTILRDGDRIEIYRPLKIDPKDARRRRAVFGRRADKV